MLFLSVDKAVANTTGTKEKRELDTKILKNKSSWHRPVYVTVVSIEAQIEEIGRISQSTSRRVKKVRKVEDTIETVG